MGKPKKEKKIATEKRRTRRKEKTEESLVQQRDNAVRALQENLAWLNSTSEKGEWGKTPEEIVSKISQEREANAQEREAILSMRSAVLHTEVALREKEAELTRQKKKVDRERSEVWGEREALNKERRESKQVQETVVKEREKLDKEIENFKAEKETRKAENLQRRLKAKSKELDSMREKLNAYKNSIEVQDVKDLRKRNDALQAELSELTDLNYRLNLHIRKLEEQISPPLLKEVNGGMVLNLPPQSQPQEPESVSKQ